MYTIIMPKRVLRLLSMFLLVFLVSHYVSAQFRTVTGESMVLKNHVEPGTRYTSRDFIKLQKGFRVKGGNGLGRSVFHIDESVEITPPPPVTEGFISFGTYITDKSLEVGALSGHFSSTPTGMATYYVPIDLPKGAGLTPKLGVNYTSAMFEAELGLGFSLSGLSEITRGSNAIFFDGNNNDYTFTSGDAFFFNGVRLIITDGNGENYENIKELRPSNDPKTIIRPIIKNGEIEAFTVIFADGKVFTLGGDNATVRSPKGVVKWRLKRVEDNFRNHMDFSYISSYSEEFGSQSRITNITYSSNASSSPTNEVLFFYKKKPETVLSYHHGIVESMPYLLERIVTQSLGQQVWAYDFEYNYQPDAPSKFKYRLHKIWKSNRENEKLNPLQINWGEDESLGEAELIGNQNNILLTSVGNGGDCVPMALNLSLPDFYNHGVNDILLTADSCENGLPFGTRILKYDPVSGEFYLADRSILEGITSKGQGNAKRSILRLSAPADFDGDGRTDFAIDVVDSTSESGTVGGVTTVTNKVELFTRFYSVNSRGALEPYRGNSQDHKIVGIEHYPFDSTRTVLDLSADFNGDGFDDLLSLFYEEVRSEEGILLGYRYLAYHRYAFETETELKEHSLFFPLGGGYDGASLETPTLSTGDFNGDGVDELFFYGARTISVFSYNTENESFELIFRDKNIFGQQERNIGKNLMFLDFNSDGLLDVLINNWEEHKLEVFLANGKNGYDEPLNSIDLQLPDFNKENNGYESLKVIDVNRDGALDLVYLDLTTDASAVVVLVNQGIISSYGQEAINFAPRYYDISERFEASVNEVQYSLGDISGTGDLYICLNKDNEGLTVFNLGKFNGVNYINSVENSMNQKLDLVFKKKSAKNYNLLNGGTGHGNAEKNDLTQNGLIRVPNTNFVLDEVIYPINKGIRLKEHFRYADDVFSRIQNRFVSANTFRRSINNKSYDYVTSVDVLNKDLYVSELEEMIHWNDEFELESRTIFSEPSTVVSSINDDIRIVYSPSSTTTNHRTNVITTNSSLRDEWGNVLEQGSSVTDGVKVYDSKAFNYEFFATEEGIPAYPTKIVAGKKRTGQVALFSSQNLMLNVDGVLDTSQSSSIVSLPSIANLHQSNVRGVLSSQEFPVLSTEVYQYDAWGNSVQNELIIGEEQFTSSYEYEPQGRFVVKSVDNEGRISSVNIEPLTGAVIQSTDFNGIESKVTRNAWNRVVSSEQQDGSFSSTDVVWGSGDVLYSEITSASGQEDVIVNYSVNHDRVEARSINYEGLTLVAHEYHDLYNTRIDDAQIENGESSYAAISGGSHIERIGTVELNTDVLGRPTQETFYMPQSGTITTSFEYEGLLVTKRKIGEQEKNSKEKSTVFNALGEPITYIDEGGLGAVQVHYDSFGRVIGRAMGDRSITYTYDDRGNLIQENDPQSGITTYTYDNLNRLIAHTDYRGLEMTTSYDSQNRPIEIQSNVGNTQYYYDGQHEQSLDSVKIGEDLHVAYEYDDLTRPTKITETYKGESTSQVLSYDDIGRNNQVSLSPTVNIKYNYYPNGQVKDILLGDEVKLTIEHYSNQGQMKAVLFGNGQRMERYMDRDEQGQIVNYTNPANPKSPKIDFGYLSISDLVVRDAIANVEDPDAYWDKALFSESIYTETHTGNILRREYNLSPEDYAYGGGNLLTETFRYDEYDRLTNIYGSVSADTMEYDRFGNITYNSRFGELSYPDLDVPINQGLTPISQKPDRIKLNEGALAPYQLPLQDIVYNAQGLPIEIRTTDEANENYSTFITYDATGKRRELTQFKSGAKVCTKKYYSDHVYIDRDGETPKKYYPISHEGVMLMMLVESSTGIEVLYTVQDYLGSLRMVLNEAGEIVNEYSYDAWGRPRDAKTWVNIGFEDVDYLADMSYTGQEYLAHTQLYHYNARLYDPIMCRMLQADKLVADPKNGQNYNRYSYVLNNPLKYTDPSGWAQQQARGSAPDFTEWHASGLGLVMINGIYQDINDPFFGPKDQMGNSISSPRVVLSADVITQSDQINSTIMMESLLNLAAVEGNKQAGNSKFGVENGKLYSYGFSEAQRIPIFGSNLGIVAFALQIDIIKTEIAGGETENLTRSTWDQIGREQAQSGGGYGFVRIDTEGFKYYGGTPPIPGIGKVKNVLKFIPRLVKKMPKTWRLMKNSSFSDWFRYGNTVVSNQIVKGAGNTGATVTWGIKGGGKLYKTGENMGFHYHIHKFNWYKPQNWFKNTPILKP